MKIGMIGLDTSHCIEFAKLLHDPQNPFHSSGGVIHAAYPFFSEDLLISKNRVKQYQDTIEKDFNIRITESIHETAKSSDAILITAVDGSKHLTLFKELLPYKLPVFIDKPMTLSLKEASELFALSQEHNVPVMSCSPLRFAESFNEVLTRNHNEITGLYVHGPLPMQEQILGYFWYGIHMIEMVIAAMGTNVKQLSVHNNRSYETIVCEWADGRNAVIRGEYQWHSRFGVTLHTNKGFYNADIEKDRKPFYASLLEEIILFFKTGKSPVQMEETLEIIHLIERINEARSRK